MAHHPIYLDYNASAPLLSEARDAMIAAMDLDANPSSVHSAGRSAKAIVQKARRDVAALVGAKADHVIFTSGATEAAQMLLSPRYSMGRSPLKMGHLYVCAADHPCLLAGGQFSPDDVTMLPVDCDGLLNMAALDEALSAHDKATGLPLVAVHYANNETGVVQPIAEIGRRVKAAGGIFVVDAVQAAGRIPIDISTGFADYLIISSHKIGGPKGAGAIIAASDLIMPLPLIKGGGQERGHRGGTEAPISLAGFGAAAAVALTNLAEYEALTTRRKYLETSLKALDSSIVIHSANAPRLANTVFFSLIGAKAETLQINFDLAGFAVSAGSACSSGKIGRSHVLTAMGVDSDEGAIRVSFGIRTTEAEINGFIDALKAILTRMKR